MIIPSMLIGAFFYMMIVSQMTKTISMFRMGDIRYTEKVRIITKDAGNSNLKSLNSTVMRYRVLQCLMPTRLLEFEPTFVLMSYARGTVTAK